MTRLFNSFCCKLPNLWHKKPGGSFADLFGNFRSILELNNRILTAIASMHSKLGGSYVFDLQYLRSAGQELEDLVRKLIYLMDSLAPGRYRGLNDAFRRICTEIDDELAGRLVIADSRLVVPFAEITPNDLDAVGGKNAHLAEIANATGLDAPRGVAATTAAYQAFMDYNRLAEPIAEITTAWKERRLSLNKASKKIRDLILAGEIPPKLRRALAKGIDPLVQESDARDFGLAVRSSAWGEDGEHSFAGQYESILGVAPDKLHDAYRQVLAGAYLASAMEYRREIGYSDDKVLMAVSFQTMVRARTSGVVYSINPRNPGDNSLVVTGSWGLGAPVVGGEAAADRFIISREPPHDQLSISVVRKQQALRIDPEGGVSFSPLPEMVQTKASLSSDEIRLLAQTALRLERYFKKPQDIEYAFDESGRLFILQARPLHVQAVNKELATSLCDCLQNYPVLLTGRGDVAQQGVGAGQVFLAHEHQSLDEFPDGAVLVARYSSPSFASVLHRSSGVITDVGSPVGHMATIAREFHVPALLNTENATKVLKDGQVITLDAEQKTVYQGLVKELRLYEFTSERIEESHEYRLLRRMLRRIEPLNLIDPTAANFNPEGCRTLHDITRFIHEKAVDELLNIGSHIRSFDPSMNGGRLKLPVPMDLTIVDIGGGLAAPSKGSSLMGRGRTVMPDQVLSAPMRAFIEGVTMPGVWDSTPVAVDFSSFMSSLTRTFSTELANPNNAIQNLAVVSESYAHLSLRLGYHFTMIDCYVSDNPADNYAYFRFAGGVTGATRRSRRARFLAEVLEKSDFSTTLQEDMVAARIKHHDAPEILRRVRILGVLVAYTRQLDVSMIDEGQIHKHAEAFGHLIEAVA